MEHSVILAEGAKGQGIGSALMTALENHAHINNIHSLIAGISADNMNAIQFHLAIGYHRVTHLKQVGFKFGQWYDLVLMQKFL